ncbi:MAG TPA: hypothetical protein VMA77_09030 [Solirubrobacteraceae bacterium]|nr:hypothetical protein [Solirubrobacteraceae bacterium]
MVATIGLAFVVAACGSSGKANHVSGSVPNAAVAFADCIRAHGVTNFPDPGPNGFNLSGIDTQSPAFQSAHQACAPLQSVSTEQGSPASESQRLAAIANAKCMRSHGVPNFPDPTFLPNGGNTVALNGLDTESPAFKRAQAACPWGPARG